MGSILASAMSLRVERITCLTTSIVGATQWTDVLRRDRVWSQELVLTRGATWLLLGKTRLMQYNVMGETQRFSVASVLGVPRLCGRS